MNDDVTAGDGRPREGDGVGRIAIIGMAGRFPGAADVAQYWANLRAGVESISRLSRAELEASGVPEALSAQPAYVPAKGLLADPEWFDAAFFDLAPREARLMDPQHRVFLECAWEALEHADTTHADTTG